MSSGNSIISSSWLNEHLQAPDVKILDASWYLPTENRFPELEFKKEHIPGATFLTLTRSVTPIAICPICFQVQKICFAGETFRDWRWSSGNHL